jgi:hypothetical protein
MYLISCYLCKLVLKKSEKSKKYYLCGGEILLSSQKLRRAKGEMVRQLADKRRGECGSLEFRRIDRKIGEMAERSNAAVLKTVILYPRNRGFESLFLR